MDTKCQILIGQRGKFKTYKTRKRKAGMLNKLKNMCACKNITNTSAKFLIGQKRELRTFKIVHRMLNTIIQISSWLSVGP